MMSKEPLATLAEKIDQLIDLNRNLKKEVEAASQENNMLRKKNVMLMHERQTLTQRNEAVSSKIEALLSKLKTLDGQYA